MVVGNKSDGGQTQESDGGNTICTSSSGENYLFLREKTLKKWVNVKNYNKDKSFLIGTSKNICTSSTMKNNLFLRDIAIY